MSDGPTDLAAYRAKLEAEAAAKRELTADDIVELMAEMPAALAGWRQCEHGLKDIALATPLVRAAFEALPQEDFWDAVSMLALEAIQNQVEADALEEAADVIAALTRKLAAR